MVQVNDDPDPTRGFPSSLPHRGPLAAVGLRLATGTEVFDIARVALDAVVPALADAASVFVTEQFLRSGPAGPDEATGVPARRLGTRFAQHVAPEAFPPEETIVFAVGSPYVRCMRSDAPVIFPQPDGQTLQRSRPDARDAFSRFASFLAVPIVAGDAAAGFLALARAAGGPAFADSDAAAAGYLAAHAGTGIANSTALSRLRTIAAALQRGLLAADPPEPEQLEVAARCLPVAGQIIGGDWYDVIPLSDGRTGIVVGDVMGHGPEAAAVMAQLRAAAHALAQLDLPPGDLLRQLNRTTTTLRGVTLATCVYAVFDSGDRSCTLAAAGHLPAVLVLPDGTTQAPDLPVGPSLGLGLDSYEQARVTLPPGAVIALYTDGLVETRIRSFEDGILALRSGLARARGPLAATCDTLITALAPRAEDDVTLVLARIPGSPDAPQAVLPGRTISPGSSLPPPPRHRGTA
jgi:serine phosphatase RsbU (regulator of sigma subunit)